MQYLCLFGIVAKVLFSVLGNSIPFTTCMLNWRGMYLKVLESFWVLVLMKCQIPRANPHCVECSYFC